MSMKMKDLRYVTVDHEIEISYMVAGETIVEKFFADPLCKEMYRLEKLEILRLEAVGEKKLLILACL
jgi:hypothetical protein